MTKNNKIKNYFASANTCRGVINYSNSIFKPRDFDKIYVIKGILAKNFILKIKEKHSCECFLNPVNPEKADAVIINKIAVIDGAAANFDDSQHPAVIINLNQFCNELILNQNKEQLLRLAEQKLDIYNSAEKFLKAANELAEYLLDLSAKYLNKKKLTAAIDRILNKRPVKNNSQTNYRFINSTAASELDTLENEASEVFYSSMENFTGFHFVRYVAQKSTGNKIICTDALDAQRINAVYLTDEKILFTLQTKNKKISSDKYNYINMERFISADFKKEHKQKLKFITKLYDSLIAEAVDCFTKINDIDSELEKIYIQSLDCAAQEKFVADFMKNL